MIPSDADIAYDLGKAFCFLAIRRLLLSHCRRSIALKPADPSPHYQLARALEKMGNREQAQQEWQRFAELKKNQPEVGGMATGRTQ